MLANCDLIHEIAQRTDLGLGDEVRNPWATTEDITEMAHPFERAIPDYPYA